MRFAPGIEAAIEAEAQAQIAKMSPLEMGRIVHPNASPVAIADVPETVLADHLTRYSRRELERGQFFEVLPGRFTFFMDHRAKRAREARQ
jgi:hypothetical protein